MRRVAVLGLSAFGEALVRELAAKRVQVLAVDVDEAKVDAIRDAAEEAVIADASDLRALEALRLRDYDAVVLSLGDRIDVSLLAVLHLRDLKVRPIYAKAISEDHRRLLLHLGVEEAIFPEADMAKRTAHTLANPGLLDTLQIGPEILVVETAPPDETVGKTLAELNLRQTRGINIIATRDTLRDQLEINPPPDRRITDSDVLIVIGKREDVERFARR
jgi:trk system potassium uptake protein TrkA